MKTLESLKEDINNLLNEIEENTGKQVEALNRETNALKKYRKTQTNR
jgi:FtsZ-binding cell division protein ZapB